ncbi:MAG: hypothetical protein M1830_004515 [Pleopsidium flavum]|nr:MAG: hypothetical protein M1830_004515 [Pleopsidium flavum]
MASKFTQRKTRFVCISDTHNASPADGAFKLPKGDVLIHAGDLTNQGSLSELRKTIDWIEQADFEAKIVVAGNHDITLDVGFYAQHGLYFHNQHPQSSEDCLQLLKTSPSITYLDHESVVIRLAKSDGPRTTFKIFGSPYSPARGLWAFGYETMQQASQLWNQIHLDTDIVVTHTPPKYHCDESKDRGAAGCEVLRETLWRVRPRFAVCGHVHEGRGAERIRWDLEARNIRSKEDDTTYWTDPGKDNKKQSLIDLTASGDAGLENNGAHGNEQEKLLHVSEQDPHKPPCKGTSSSRTLTSFKSKGCHSSVAPSSVPNAYCSTVPTFPSIGSRPTENVSLYQSTVSGHTVSVPTGPESAGFATQGQGGILLSGRCDMEALSGRMGRKETCVINAAIKASSWSDKGRAGHRFNKPIVVDINLPVRADPADDLSDA